MWESRGGSQGGGASVYPLATPEFQETLAAAVPEHTPIDWRKLYELGYVTMRAAQPASMYQQTYTYIANFFNVFVGALGRNPLAATWDRVTLPYVVTHFNTPALFITGTDDAMCPYTQSVDLNTALKAAGKTSNIWIYQNGSVNYGSAPIQSLAHGLSDANSPTKRGFIKRNFFLHRMAPNVSEVVYNHPADYDIHAIFTNFRQAICADPASKQNVSDLMMHAANPIIRYASSDPNVPAGRGETTIAGVINRVWSAEGVQWTAANVRNKLQTGQLPNCGQAVGAPTAPTSVAFSNATPTNLTLNWSGATGAVAGYRYYIATDANFTNYVYAHYDAGLATSVNIPGLTPGQTYYGRVRAYDAGGNLSAYSPTASRATLGSLAAPTQVTFTNPTTTGLTLNWSGATGAVAGYRYYIATDANFTNYVYAHYDAGLATSVNIPGLTPGQTYYGRVRAYDAGGNLSAYSPIASTTLSAMIATLTLNGGATPLFGIPGNQVTWNWNSLDATSGSGVLQVLDSVYRPISTDGCGNTSGPVSWLSGTSGTYAPVVSSCMSGFNYEITYTAQGAGGTATSKATLRVLTGSVTPGALPRVSAAYIQASGVQYGNAITGSNSTIELKSMSSLSNLVIDLQGSNFSAGDTLQWNSKPMVTTIVSPTQAKANIPVSQLTEGSVNVQVVTVQGDKSNALQFRITKAATTQLGDVRVYPNPVKVNKGQLAVNFDQLPVGCSIKIYSVDGRWVRSLRADSVPVAWDLKNDSGEGVAAGIYLYTIEDLAGNMKRGKFVVIR